MAPPVALIESSFESLGPRGDSFVAAFYDCLFERHPAVGEALLATFPTFLEPAWTPALTQAWTDAYGAISAAMLEGGAGVAA